MSLWSKIKSFFMSIFSHKDDEVSSTNESSNTNEDNTNSNTESTSNDVDYSVSEPVVSNDTTVTEVAVKPATDVTNTSTHKCVFTDEEKEAILNVIRPVIKSINSDALYTNLCEMILQSKTLKTYASLSEDSKTLSIKLTQNSIFNEQISEFIASHVLSLFKSSIDAEFLGKYVVTAVNGVINITKIG